MKTLGSVIGVMFVVSMVICGLGLAFFMPLFIIGLPMLAIPAGFLYQLLKANIETIVNELRLFSFHGTSEMQIAKIQKAIPKLYPELNVGPYLRYQFSKMADGWSFLLSYNNPSIRIHSFCRGPTPIAAFLLAKGDIDSQLELRRHILNLEDNVDAHEKLLQLKKPNTLKAVIIDDDIDFSEMAAISIRKLGIDVKVVNDPKNSFVFEDFQPDFVLLDLNLSPMFNGIDMVKQTENLIHQNSTLDHKYSDKKIKLVTISATDTTAAEFQSSKYFDFEGHWLKPLSFEKLRENTAQLLLAAGGEYGNI